MNNLVSVVMSVYNGEKYLGEAIESILTQTYKEFEFIIINDGSTDSSLEIIKSYKDGRIKLIDNMGNKGLVFSLNRGLDNASGKYILRMDADDISLPTRIEEQVNFMENNLDIAISGTDALFFGENLKSYIFRMPNTFSKVNSQTLTLTPFLHPTIIIRSGVIKKYKYNENFRGTEDFELWVRI